VITIDDPRYVRAISHPLRIRLLAALDEQPASPVMLAEMFDQPLGTVAYHVRTCGVSEFATERSHFSAQRCGL
jgi:DNA-binding transcriptional ArsR family regulator